VGLGGRLDSTNIVHPVLSLITSIAFDHTRQLGNTLGLIAGEKAGILKRSRPAVSGVVADEPRDVIRRVARARSCPLRELGIDFTCEAHPPDPPLNRPTPGTVRVRTWRRDWGRLPLPLLGMHQAHNAAVALAGLDLLGEREPTLDLDRDAVAAGFATLRWPARVEVVGEAPWLVIDGAHNVSSAEALAETLRTCFPETPRTLVFGTSRDKDLPGQLRALCPLFDTLIASRYVRNPRFVPSETVAASMVSVAGRSTHVTRDPAEALETAFRLTPREGLICVTGSLFLAAEARAVVLGEETVGAGTTLVT
jgi:dihydrofolate synthase/folylpolyglutamate synthase